MITILCSGSRGDIQPYVALAQALKARGEAVRIVTGGSFAAWVESCGISCVPLSADMNRVQVDPKLLESARNSTNPFKMLLTFGQMKKYARLMVDEMYDACAGSDVIVYHPGCTVGFFAAEKMGIPSVLASPFPMHRTKAHASVIAYGRRGLPAGLSYTMLQQMLWMASSAGIRSFWKERFKKLPRGFSVPFERVDERHPAIVSCSNAVFPRPADWNGNIHQHGYWLLKTQTTYTPEPVLRNFLSRGEKPVYFGFGSVFSQEEQKEFVKTIVQSLQNTGRRGILCGMGSVENLPDGIIAIDSVPHDWLFPQCAAVCHHGGAGTTAAGFAAGVPAVIVPFSNDQFAWAHRAYDIGVGARPVYKKDFDAEHLTSAIRFALSEPVVSAAKQLAGKMAAENGAESCAQIIARLIKKED